MNLELPRESDHWRRIAAVLDLALDLPPEERTAVLDQTCEDPELRAQVDAFLAADTDAGAFLGSPVGEYAPELLAEAAEAAEDEIEAADLTGHQLGRYRLLREIGSGGMGTVYEAEDTQLGRRVAVKVLPPEYSRDPRAKERFLREARTAAAVDHPNLCTVHDAGESDGRLYIVLSFYEGETLRERIRRGPLAIEEAREVAIQVTRGLARAHDAGIVHRDIKPANVMLPRRGEAKILDFGIARLEGDEVSLSRTDASWGTPAYMSPEHARGEPVDARTDLWSLGVLLYEMLAGRRPFGGESLDALVSSILTQEPEPLERIRPDVPPELARVVKRALAKDPAERYANATDLLANLEAGKSPGPGLLRRRALWVGLSCGALAALVLLVFAARQLLWQAEVRPPLRVAVLKPAVQSERQDPNLSFVASEVMQSALAALVSLEGVQVLDPPERNEDRRVETARLGEADEVLLPVIDSREGSYQVTLYRRKPEDVIREVSKPFRVQGGFEDAYQLAEAVAVHVQQVYSDYRPRPESPGVVRSEDYSAYIALERQTVDGKSLNQKELDQLDALLKTSPGLIGAYVLATGVARGLGNFPRAFQYAEQAEKRAPYDPRPLWAHLRAEVEGNRLDAAPATLARLENLAPGDIRAKTARADLLEARGKLGGARSLLEEVARRRPSWRYIRKLATLEFRMGESDSARRRLKDLLATQPDNQAVREGLAALEILYGDLQRAADIYQDLIHSGRAAPYLPTNLGFVRYLLGDYAGAEAAYRQYHSLNPDDVVTRFNIATAREAQGDATGARHIYRVLAKELAAAPAQQDKHTHMLHAQCLVRLGQRADAARIAGEALKQTPEDVQDLHQAAQVYALLGEPRLALSYAELARKKGLQRAWFTIPEFRSLEKYSAFQKLLDRAVGSQIAS